eukprot:10254320-Alexandrium_andersonii.AAC.1
MSSGARLATASPTSPLKRRTMPREGEGTGCGRPRRLEEKLHVGGLLKDASERCSLMYRSASCLTRP